MQVYSLVYRFASSPQNLMKGLPEFSKDVLQVGVLRLGLAPARRPRPHSPLGTTEGGFGPLTLAGSGKARWLMLGPLVVNFGSEKLSRTPTHMRRDPDFPPFVVSPSSSGDGLGGPRLALAQRVLGSGRVRCMSVLAHPWLVRSVKTSLGRQCAMDVCSKSSGSGIFMCKIKSCRCSCREPGCAGFH